MTESFKCPHCTKSFVKASTLFIHVCEQKRRALAKHEKHVVIGYDTYNRFYRRTQNSSQDKTYDDFAKSPYYNAFIKFGSFVSNVKPLYPGNFIDYVVTSGIKLDHWCRDSVYDSYVLNLIKTEQVETALERGITHMLEWGDANGAAWNHYFLYVSVSRAAYDIKDGKISPWLVLNSANGKILLNKFDDTQISMISTVIEPQYWIRRFKKLPADVALVKQVIKESAI
jgi:hypothetical protein